MFVPSYESYGQIWPHIHTRVIASLFLFQVTMLGYFGVKKFYYTPILIPLPICSLLFALVCSKKFYRFFHYTAMEVACHELKEIPNMEHVFRSYIPPPLAAEKVDDDQFEDAASHVSKTVTSV